MRVALVSGFLLAGFAVPAMGADPLPEGDEGVAADYPGDAGIENDPEVIFADDFEGYSDASELADRWDAGVYQNEQIRIATEAENVYAGSQALEFTVPQQEAELSNATDKTVAPERDVLFLRYYSKFEPPFDVVGSSHNGAMISAHYFENGQATPGVPADGTNKFLANLESWRGEEATASPGLLNIYIYHPEQRSQWGDHFFPTGMVLPNSNMPFDFGPDFVSRPDIIPELDTWYCYEYMLQANTPGARDGRIAIWLDGALVADFQNLRLRDVDTLKIDRFGLSFHIASNPDGETRKWYDNVVAASTYIGPLFDPGSGGDTSGSDSGGPSSGGSGSASDAGGAVDDGDTGSGTGGTSSDPGTDTDAPAEDESAAGCGCRASGETLPTFALLSLWSCVRRRQTSHSA